MCSWAPVGTTTIPLYKRREHVLALASALQTSLLREFGRLQASDLELCSSDFATFERRMLDKDREFVIAIVAMSIKSLSWYVTSLSLVCGIAYLRQADLTLLPQHHCAEKSRHCRGRAAAPHI